jgi:hypothetical protein
MTRRPPASKSTTGAAATAISGGSVPTVGIFGQTIATFRDERVVVVVNSARPTAVGEELTAAREAFVQAARAAAVAH